MSVKLQTVRYHHVQVKAKNLVKAIPLNSCMHFYFGAIFTFLNF